jgi:hypothetical protein
VTGVSTMCPSSVEEPKAGQKRPRKRFFTSIQVNQPSAPAPAPHPPDESSNSQRLTTQSIPY